MTNLYLRENAADRLRGSLLSGLSELDRRRRRFTPEAIGQRARDSAIVRGTVVLVGAGIAGGAFALAYWIKRRNRPTERLRRHMRARKDVLLRLWREPERLAASEPPLRSMLVRKIALIAVTALATAASKQTTARLLPTH